MLHIIVPLWKESTDHRWIPLIKTGTNWKAFPYHDIIKFMLIYVSIDQELNVCVAGPHPGINMGDLRSTLCTAWSVPRFLDVR